MTTVPLQFPSMVLAPPTPSVLLHTRELLVNVSPASKVTVRPVPTSTSVTRESPFATPTLPVKTVTVLTLVSVMLDTLETARPALACVLL